MHDKRVDVCINVYGKPYQTALSLLSLLRFSGQHIGHIYVIMEPQQPEYDGLSSLEWLPCLLALGVEYDVYTPKVWNWINTTVTARLQDRDYRLSMRYQYGFEKTSSDYLFLMHNDIYVFGNIIQALLAEIGDAIIAGEVGQCWNCPASMLKNWQAGEGFVQACNSGKYQQFKPSFDELVELYNAAKGIPKVKPYWAQWSVEFKERPWPLPECRVNEWACLLNMQKARKITMPKGPVLPFGAYVSAGSQTMDIGAAWFRGVHKLGFYAQHVNIYQCLQHTMGHPKLFKQDLYHWAENQARLILEQEYPEFVDWCGQNSNKMFRNG